MTRVRTDNVFGTVTDDPLTAGATTLNSAGLADLAVVSSAEAIITLDPNRINGDPEIVVVTAHTGSATSATIQRGQFGTSAREHPADTEWVHGPIASNASSYATAADDQGDYVPMNAWESWTPTWTNLTVGSSTVVAKYQRVGRTIRWRLTVTLSGATVGDARFTLPVTAAGDYASSSTLGHIGSGTLLDITGQTWNSQVRMISTTQARILWWNTSANAAVLSSTSPFTWANGDIIELNGQYEAAS